MDGVRQYILTVISAAIITSILVRFAGKQQTTASIIKLIGAIFISITVISPFVKLQIQDITDYISALDFNATDIISEAKSQSTNQTISVITERAQTYIEDTAAVYGTEITASIGVSNPDSLIPDTITIEGKVSPYIKQILQDVIINDLGIQEDKQIWK